MNNSGLAYVYVIQNALGLVKVGVTVNPLTRFKSIENSSGLAIIKHYVSSACTNAKGIESALLREHKDFRLLGEWLGVPYEVVCQSLDKHFSHDLPTSNVQIQPCSRPKNGRGDTDTTGKHSTRFKAYCTAVKKGLANPTIYALVRYPINGKKIGSTTAMEFLQAMNESGLIQKIEKGGKVTYILA